MARISESWTPVEMSTEYIPSSKPEFCPHPNALLQLALKRASNVYSFLRLICNVQALIANGQAAEPNHDATNKYFVNLSCSHLPDI
jgi:hypothetical protein